MLKEEEKQGPLPTEKEIYKRVFSIAWPAVLESLLISFISMADTAMVSALGKEAISGVGITGQPRSIALSVIFSLNVGVTAVISRRRGENNREGANRCLKQSLLISILLSTIMGAICIVFARPILLFSGAQMDYIEPAVEYCRIVMAGLVFTAISQTLTAAQRGCGRTRVSMWANLTANVVNVILNYLLIGGHLGFPALGVRGAAIASLVGYIVSALIAFISVTRKNGFLCILSRDSWWFDRETMQGVIKVGGNAAIEQVVFSRIGYFLCGKLTATLGTVAYAVQQICSNLMSVGLSFTDGFCVTASALMGQSLGEKRADKAQVYVKVCQRIAFWGGLLLTLAFIGLRRPLMLIYSKEADVIALGMRIMVILGLTTNVQIVQNIYTASLRGAGDTRFVAWISMISVMILRPFLLWLLAYPMGWGLEGAWIACWIDQFVRLIFAWQRFAGGKWKTIEV